MYKALSGRARIYELRSLPVAVYLYGAEAPRRLPLGRRWEQSSCWDSAPLFLGPVLLAHPGPRWGPAADPAAHLIRLWFRIPSALLRKENSLGAFTLVIK